MPAEGNSPPAQNQPAQGALSLVQAEAILGINHFNWLQTYSIPAYEHEYLSYGTSMQTELASPILDPDDVSGNQSNLVLYSDIAGRGQSFAPLPTDFWPYYWDEPSEVQQYQLPTGSSTPSELEFYDAPMQPDDFLNPSDSWSFTTQLSGVTAGPVYSEIPLALTPFFSWNCNTVYNQITSPYPSGGGIFMKSTDPSILPPVLSGGIFDIQVGVEPPTILSAVSGSGTSGETAALSATLSSNGSPLSGETIVFTLNQGGTVTSVGTATTNASGIATLSGVSLASFNAGTYSGSVGASFAGSPTDGGSSEYGDLTVKPTQAVLALGGLTFTYDGTSHAASVATDPAGLTGVMVTYTQNGGAVAAPTRAGSYSVTAALNNPNYTAASVTGTLVINQATPTINWSNPADITYGTPLGGTQLDAATAVPGGFVYTPPLGTVLGGGSSQTLSETFTPTDTTDYQSVTTQVTISVDPVTTIFTALASPRITVGATSTTLSGQIAAGSLIPTGKVAITLDGATELAAINATTGAFSASFSTATLATASSPYPVAYAYAGNADYAAANGNGSLTVSTQTPTPTLDAQPFADAYADSNHNADTNTNSNANVDNQPRANSDGDHPRATAVPPQAEQEGQAHRQGDALRFHPRLQRRAQCRGRNERRQLPGRHHHHQTGQEEERGDFDSHHEIHSLISRLERRGRDHIRGRPDVPERRPDRRPQRPHDRFRRHAQRARGVHHLQRREERWAVMSPSAHISKRLKQ